MDSFNNGPIDLNNYCNRLYLDHFFDDYMLYRNNRVETDAKTPEQKKFERFMTDKKIVIIDYTRTLTEPKYFTTLASYITKSGKANIVYNNRRLSYISTNSIFMTYEIPKNPTDQILQNIYDYLLVHQERPCIRCKINDPFFYCVYCGSYYCKNCVYEQMDVVNMGKVEHYYHRCRNCLNFRVLYRIPSNVCI